MWRRVGGAVVCERERFRPWLLLDRLDDLRHLGDALGPEGSDAVVWWRELRGDGALRFLVTRGRRAAPHARRAARRSRPTRPRGRGTCATSARAAVLSLPPEEQYLVATGRTYFRGLDVRRPAPPAVRPRDDRPRRDARPHLHDRRARSRRRDARARGAGRRRRRRGRADPRARWPSCAPPIRTSIENHNLHGFDLPFLETRAPAARRAARVGHGCPAPRLRTRAAMRGSPLADAATATARRAACATSRRGAS